MGHPINSRLWLSGSFKRKGPRAHDLAVNPREAPEPAKPCEMKFRDVSMGE